MSDPACSECIKVRSLSQSCSQSLTKPQGTIHAGQPVGKEEQVHGLNTYVVGNRQNPRGIIVVYSDIFGLKLPNNKLIADAYAKSGVDGALGCGE